MKEKELAMIDTTLLDTTQEATSPNGSIEWLEPEDESAMRQLIFQAEDRPEELVEVPEWRLRVLVRGMTGTQRVIYETMPRDESTNRVNLRTAYAEAVIMCCYFPKNKEKQVFKLVDRDELMNRKSGDVIGRLATKALELSGMLPRQAEAAAKNSEATPTSMPTTDSP